MNKKQDRGILAIPYLFSKVFLLLPFFWGLLFSFWLASPASGHLTDIFYSWNYSADKDDDSLLGEEPSTSDWRLWLSDCMELETENDDDSKGHGFQVKANQQFGISEKGLNPSLCIEITPSTKLFVLYHCWKSFLI